MGTSGNELKTPFVASADKNVPSSLGVSGLTWHRTGEVDVDDN